MSSHTSLWHAQNTAPRRCSTTIELSCGEKTPFGSLKLEAGELAADGSSIQMFDENFPPVKLGLFDVSSGMEDVEHGVDGRAEQVDDAREGSGVAIASGASAGCLEQPIERFEAGIGMA